MKVLDDSERKELLKELFDALDPQKMGEDFRAALALDDEEKLIHAAAWHFRTRAPRNYCRNIDRSRCSEKTAEQAVKGSVTVVNVPWKFPDGKIDWHFNPTGKDTALNHEWLWQLNRMNFWLDMCAAYEKTHDDKYALAFNEQVYSWIAAAGTYGSNWNAPGSVWRTIEAGLRLMYSWQLGFETFRKSELFSDENICLMLSSMYRQAQHLQSRHKTKNNWMLMEMSGLYTFAALFQEFKQSAAMREYSAEVFSKSVMVQILPDGMHDELSPDYHKVLILCAAAFLQVSRDENINSGLPDSFMEKLELSFEAVLNMSMPNFVSPRTNDSFTCPIVQSMRTALQFFPHRQDFRWTATLRKEGKEPSAVPSSSRFLNWAGFSVMRSDWSADAAYCCFDAGPLGTGHRHQDKLNINISKGADELIYDDGGGQYEQSIYRTYGISSAAHNTILVDGLVQKRSEPDKADTPIDVNWISNEKYDYACGSYDGSWGNFSQETHNSFVKHTRQVRFYKPDFFCVRDKVCSLDGKTHSCEMRLHLDTLNVENVKNISKAFLSNYGRTYDILIVPLFPEELSCGTLVGVDTYPMGGWFVGRNDKSLHKSTTVTMTVKDKYNCCFSTLLIPFEREKDEFPEITKLDGSTFLFRFKGREHVIDLEHLSE